MSTLSSTGSRTEAILQALRREIADRRVGIDACEDLAEVRLTIRLRAGTSWIVSTQYTEERIVRARHQRGS